MAYIHPRIRIGIVLIISFMVSGFIMKYAQESPDRGVSAPHVRIQSIVNDFSHLVSNSRSEFITALQSIRIPSFISFSPSNSPNEPPIEPTFEPSTPDEEPIGEEPVSDPDEPPTSTPVFSKPVTTIPTRAISQKPSPRPTVPYKPTNPPQPTKPPKPTSPPELPPITSDTRPGTSLKEILNEVEKRACVPAALLMAIKTVETGERFKNDSAATIKIYNTYGWWKTGTGDSCYGYGYHTQTGIVPQDSVQAGQKCSSAVGNPTDIKIMGLMQVSEWEQETTRKNTTKTLPQSIDRRVLFDNTLIFAWATRGRAGNSPQPSCSDWPAETVKLVAEKHHGVCKYDYGTGNAGNYCEKIWELYKSFK